MAEWISVEERLPEGDCLVYLEKKFLNLRIHSASYHKNLVIIGGYFSYDTPKVTHWIPFPEPPKEEKP